MAADWTRMMCKSCCLLPIGQSAKEEGGISTDCPFAQPQAGTRHIVEQGWACAWPAKPVMHSTALTNYGRALGKPRSHRNFLSMHHVQATHQGVMQARVPGLEYVKVWLAGKLRACDAQRGDQEPWRIPRADCVSSYRVQATHHGAPLGWGT